MIIKESEKILQQLTAENLLPGRRGYPGEVQPRMQ